MLIIEKPKFPTRTQIQLKVCILVLKNFHVNPNCSRAIYTVKAPVRDGYRAGARHSLLVAQGSCAHALERKNAKSTHIRLVRVFELEALCGRIECPAEGAVSVVLDCGLGLGKAWLTRYPF